VATDASTRERTIERLLGVTLLMVLAVHSRSMHPSEMLWASDVSATVLAIGLVAGAPRLMAAGFLVPASCGFVLYLVQVWLDRGTTPTSLLIHTLPLAMGGWVLHRRGWPRGVAPWAWLFYFSLVPLCYFATDPSLNINVSHAPWRPVAGLFTHLWAYWLANAAASLAVFLVADALFRRWLPGQPKPAAVSSSAG
jgi:hypothetical protein